MSLKQKTVKGLSWSIIDQIGNQGISFIVGIILARLLSPREFGLIGMITIFIALSESFINSGFSDALIRKKNCTNTDYSTVFYFNLIVGILFTAILYFSAPAIATFFDESELIPIVRVMGIILIIDSLTIIQRTILTKRIDFKLQTRISIIASIGSGVVAIIMAFNGYGVWSLVIQRISRQALNSFFLWLWNNWRPKLIFSIKSFKELFGFGNKLLISGLISTIFQNIYYFIIGKFFSTETLGYYTKANDFNRVPSEGLNGVISRVSYPVLSTIQDDKPRLKQNYQKLLRSTMFITFILMLGMAAVAEPMILTLIGEKWRQSIIYLQLLCFVGMMYPLHALNLNMLKVLGRSDLFLKLEILKKFLAIPTIIIGIYWGVEALILGMIVNSQIAYFLNSYWSGKFIDYPTKEQISDILPSFLLALSMSIAVFLIGQILQLEPIMKLVIQIMSGAIIVFLAGELFKLKDYLFIKSIVIEQAINFRNDKIIKS
jgi:O-antigen/teichoic acid export membrane protein